MRSAFKIGLLLLCALLVNMAQGKEKEEFTKIIKKEFDITANGTTHLVNRFGKVEVHTWDRKRVKISATIVVRAPDETTAQSVFNRIRIKFDNNRNFVKAVTEIEPEKQSWWKINVAIKKSDFSIHYDVFVPSSNNLVLEQSFGDVSIAAMEGKGDLSIEHANFKLTGFDSDANLKIAHSSGLVQRTQNVRAEILNSKIRFQQAKDMVAETKHSSLTVEKANDVRVESRNNTLEIGQVQIFRNIGVSDQIKIAKAAVIAVGSKYSSVRIGQVSKSLDLDLEYGEASVDEVVKGFSGVSLNGRHSVFSIKLAKGDTYQMDALADFAGVKYPKGMKIVYENEGKNTHSVKGYVGTATAPNIIKARLTYGALKVEQK